MQQPTISSFVPDLWQPQRVLLLVVSAELFALVLTLANAYSVPFSLERLALVSIFVQLIALTAALLVAILRRPLNRIAPAWAALGVVAIVIGTTLCYSLLVPHLELALPGHWEGTVWVNVAIATLCSGWLMRYFYVREMLLAQEKSALEARIQALQSRIRPHFLFNSMNIISSLIAVDPVMAEQAVEDLSRLFRASLRESGAVVPLTQELDLCRRYERIEKLRMGHRLRVNWRVETDLDDVLIPLLTLQPLLENAIYHGIQPLPEGGEVQIRIHEEGGLLVIRISNPLPPEAAQGQHRGNRMALENIRHRLAALHGDRARLEAAADNDEYRVTLRYPRA